MHTINTIAKTDEKRMYSTPSLVRIKLDHEVSLALESTPPDGPNESITFAPDYFNNDPFKSYLG